VTPEPKGRIVTLARAIREGRIILFVGAGVSMNLGLPSSWDALIEKCAEEVGFGCEQYVQMGDVYALAEYYRIQKGGISGLLQWMHSHWHPDDVSVEHSEVHRLICELDFPLIYTTNYDTWLERAFDHYSKPYIKISSASDLLKAVGHSPQIIKFHGDIDDEESIVLGETSYFQRLEFESPLDIKLRADTLSRGVLFIGYGLSDINLRYMFFKLSQLWKNHHATDHRPASYIFSPQPNAVQAAIFNQWGIEMIAREAATPSIALETFLTELLEAAG